MMNNRDERKKKKNVSQPFSNVLFNTPHIMHNIISVEWDRVFGSFVIHFNTAKKQPLQQQHRNGRITSNFAILFIRFPSIFFQLFRFMLFSTIYSRIFLVTATCRYSRSTQNQIHSQRFHHVQYTKWRVYFFQRPKFKKPQKVCFQWIFV